MTTAARDIQDLMHKCDPCDVPSEHDIAAILAKHFPPAEPAADVERLKAWLLDPHRKRPELAFSAGPERELADLIESIRPAEPAAAPVEPAERGAERPDATGVWFRDGQFWVIRSLGRIPTFATSIDENGYRNPTVYFENLPTGHWQRAVPAGEVFRLRLELLEAHAKSIAFNDAVESELSGLRRRIAALEAQLADANLLLGNGWQNVCELSGRNPSVEAMLRCQLAKLAGDVAVLEEQLADSQEQLNKLVSMGEAAAAKISITGAFESNRSQLAERPKVSEWQPIESAPKNGTTVLLFRYLHGWSVWGHGHWVVVSGIGGWLARGIHDPPGELGLCDPTHWMPLPAPPAESQP